MSDRPAPTHPGRILQCFDHFVIDLRGEGRAATYFTVYAVEYSPELGTGHVAFLRARDEDPRADLNLTLTDTPDLARRMQQRLQRLIATVDVSRGIGTELDQEPVPARFERGPWTAAGVGWRIVPEAPGTPEITADWSNGREPCWAAAMAGTFTGERDILGVMAAFESASVRIGGWEAPGAPYHDPWWEPRIGYPFSSCHVALAESSLTPAGSAWWGSLG